MTPNINRKRILVYNRLTTKTISFQIIGTRTMIPTIINVIVMIVDNITLLFYLLQR